MVPGSETLDQLTSIKKQRPFRKALLRGLGVLMPPLLTIVLFLWAWNIIVSYVLEPIESTALAVFMVNADILNAPPPSAEPLRFVPVGTTRDNEQLNVGASRDANSPRNRVGDFALRDGFSYKGNNYVRVTQKYIPEEVFQMVEDEPGDVAPTTPKSYYRRYYELKYLQRHMTVPIFLLAFVLVLYLLGKFIAAGVGRIFWNSIERIVNRLPLISNVYSSVKQVTDFAFSQTELQYTRVVAVQYPRKGVWSMGFVTGEGMLDIRMAANEPVMSVLMPTSPMPATGFTITVPKSDTIDLNITIDQAIQFCVSCGVVVPNHQQQHHLRASSDGGSVEGMLPAGKLLPKTAEDDGEETASDSEPGSGANPPKDTVDEARGGNRPDKRVSE